MLEKQFPGLRFRGSLSRNGHVSSLEASWVLPHLHIWVPVWRAPTASPHSHRRRPVPCRSERTECEVGSGSPPLWRELKQKHTRSQTMTVSVGSCPPAPGDGPPKRWCSGSWAWAYQNYNLTNEFIARNGHTYTKRQCLAHLSGVTKVESLTC